MLKEKSKKIEYHILLTIVFIILSLIFVLPFAKMNTIFSGDDMYYHLQRINELINNFRNGNFFIGIYTHTFDKVGYPLNLFYPWITLIPFVAFSIFIKSQALAIYLGISFFTFLTLIFTYWTTKKYSKNSIQSVITAIMYSFCSYRTIDIFARFALGEYIALTFLPLCIYGLYSVVHGNYRDWPFLAFGMSFVLLSHVLSTYIYAIFLVVLFMLCLFNPVNDKLKRLIALIKAIIVSIASSAIFLFPFLEQILFQKFRQPGKVEMSDLALIPSKLVEASINNTLGRNVSGNTYNIGFILLVVIILGIIFYSKFKLDYKIIFMLAIIFLIATTTLLPWSQIEKTSISVIQFPWRFLGISSYLLSIVGGYEYTLITRNKKKISFLTIGIVLILIPWYSGISNMKRDIVNPEQYVNYHYIVLKGNRFTYSHEVGNNLKNQFYLDQYSPKNGLSSLSDVINHNALVNGKVVNLDKMNSNSANKLEFYSNKFKNSRNIILPMYMYRNLYAINGNGQKLTISTNKDSRIKINNTFGSNKIIIQYKLSKIDIFSIILSVVTWALGIFLFIKNSFIKFRS